MPYAPRSLWFVLSLGGVACRVGAGDDEGSVGVDDSADDSATAWSADDGGDRGTGGDGASTSADDGVSDATASDGSSGGDTGEPEPNCPPEGPVCEADPAARCIYVAPGGDDTAGGGLDSPLHTIQVAVDQAGPGDFVYVREGTYTPGDQPLVRDSAMGAIHGVALSGVQSGNEGSPITLKGYPCEDAVLDNLSIEVGGGVGFWVVEGLTIRGRGDVELVSREFNGGNIEIGGGAHDIVVRGNDIGHYAVLGGTNPALIKIVGTASGAGVTDVLIEDNALHDLYHLACEQGTPHCNSPSAAGLAWSEVGDTEHCAAVTQMSCSAGGACQTGRVEFRNNDVYRVPSAFYFKHEHDGPTVIEGNHFHDLQRIGIWSSNNVTFTGNIANAVVGGSGAPVAGMGPRTRFGAANVNVIGNTFVDMNLVLHLASVGSGHTVRDNVVFGLDQTGQQAAYIRSTAGLSSAPGNDFDHNCFITSDPGFVALQIDNSNYTLDQARSDFGFEGSSELIATGDATSVFADPAAGDYALIGAAAEQCDGLGAP